MVSEFRAISKVPALVRFRQSIVLVIIHSSVFRWRVGGLTSDESRNVVSVETSPRERVGLVAQHSRDLRHVEMKQVEYYDCNSILLLRWPSLIIVSWHEIVFLLESRIMCCRIRRWGTLVIVSRLSNHEQCDFTKLRRPRMNIDLKQQQAQKLHLQLHVLTCTEHHIEPHACQ